MLAEREIGKKRRDLLRPLDNPEIQDEFVNLGVIQRSDWHGPNYVEVVDGTPAPVRARLGLLLESRRGQVMSPYTLCEQMWGDSGDVQMNKLRNAVYFLAPRLKNQDDFISAQGVGYGLGVSECRLRSAMQVALLGAAIKRSKEGRLMSLEEVLHELYGEDEDAWPPNADRCFYSVRLIFNENVPAPARIMSLGKGRFGLTN